MADLSKIDDQRGVFAGMQIAAAGLIDAAGKASFTLGLGAMGGALAHIAVWAVIAKLGVTVPYVENAIWVFSFGAGATCATFGKAFDARWTRRYTHLESNNVQVNVNIPSDGGSTIGNAKIALAVESAGSTSSQ